MILSILGDFLKDMMNLAPYSLPQVKRATAGPPRMYVMYHLFRVWLACLGEEVNRNVITGSASPKRL